MDMKWARTCAGLVSVTWHDGMVVNVDLKPARGVADPVLSRQLEQTRKTGRVPKSLRFDTRGLPGFTRHALRVCAGIKPGHTMTYSELAAAAGRPGAARAAGRVMARNPFPLLVPCHRVVGKDGRLTGFGGGLAMKRALLAAEGWSFAGSGKRTRIAGKMKESRL